MKKKIITTTVLVLFLTPVLAFFALLVIINPVVPLDNWASMDERILDKYSVSFQVLDDEGSEITRITPSGNEICKLSSLPAHVIHAFVAAEDKRFYSHDGIDYYRIVGALYSNIKSMSLKEGASTITQQFVKNTHLNSEKTFDRKIKEMRIAKEIEETHSKEEILEMYLNALYFGNNTYGITAAADLYFNVYPSQLSLVQSATLAAIINNPNKFDPIKNPENAKSRRNIVLGRMLEENYITASECEVAKCSDVNTQIKCVFSQYTRYLSNFIAKLQCSMSDIIAVETSFDKVMQSTVERAIQKNNVESELISSIVIDIESGELLAAAANTPADISSLCRQPGSIIKPIVSFAPAIEDNVITPLSYLNDCRTDFDGYSPSNYNGKYHGWQTAEFCLANSLNVPAVKLLDICGIERAKLFAQKLGLQFNKDDNGLAIALGGLRDGVALKTLADAYVAFANNGRYGESGCCRRIQFSDKSTKDIAPSRCRVMHEDTAYFINKMLGSCAKSGTAKKLRSLPNIAAKTGTVGTSNGNTDAYCIAYNSKYLTAVWMGATSGVMSQSATGGGIPTGICYDIMKNPALSSKDFDRPYSIVSLEVDANEYYKNHRFVKANDNAKPKDVLVADFSLRNLPKSKAKASRQNSQDLVGNNFKLVDDLAN